MIWNRFKGTSKKEADHTPQLSLKPWDALVRDIFAYYGRTRQQLYPVQKWDYQVLLNNGIHNKIVGNLHIATSRLFEAFQAARQQELQEGSRYLKDLRGLLWKSVDQICEVLESGERDMVPIASARQSLQKALHTSDLDSAKLVISDVLTALSKADHHRLDTIDKLQKSFKQQMELLQCELQTVQKEMQLDGLTGVYNRATFDQQLKKIQQIAYLSGDPAFLIILDIDHFKQVNDTYGHPAGDLVIQVFARTIAQIFSRKTDFVARYGGEEFAVLCQGDNLVQTRELLAKLLVKVRSLKIEQDSQVIRFSTSAGLASYQLGESPKKWLTNADKALYEAKQQGRDRFIIASSSTLKAS